MDIKLETELINTSNPTFGGMRENQIGNLGEPVGFESQLIHTVSASSACIVLFFLLQA
jgi:hypothetical protein